VSEVSLLIPFYHFNESITSLCFRIPYALFSGTGGEKELAIQKLFKALTKVKHCTGIKFSIVCGCQLIM